MANDCGAFLVPEIYLDAMDEDCLGDLLDYFEDEVVSVVAWVNAVVEDGHVVDGEPLAIWPVYLPSTEPQP